MAARLTSSSRHFEEEFAKLLKHREEGAQDVSATVADIIRNVRENGDAALADYTRRFDRYDVKPGNFRVPPEQVAQAISLCSPEVMKSLKMAAARIRAYSEKQMPEDALYTDEAGVKLGWKWTPLDSVGLYVPGGKAAYPSSVLMNAVLAKVAGVSRLVMVVPAPDGEIKPAVLAAAHVAGIDEIYAIGGAQAVAALAYGTQSVAPVDKIVGPGNAYVAEAKRQVFGQVGIDMIAGPSEILVIADGAAEPEWLAADLLSQAEHDEMAQSVLITDSPALAARVEQAVAAQLQTLPRSNIAGASWHNFGAVITVHNLEEAVQISNRLAPEHLELCVAEPEKLLPLVRHAGAVFMGRHTPEAIGDYMAGPSHVLPTSRTARFSSGLSVMDFIKRSSIIGCSPEALARLGMYTEVLATVEGLDAHGRSVTVRRGDKA